jgi:hypothetical protein
MPMKVGDRVRTAAGEEGLIVSLKVDGLRAYVRTRENAKDAAIRLYRLDRLIKIDGELAK